MITRTVIFKKTFALLASCTILLTATAVASAACVQNRAAYSDKNQNYTLTFSPSQKEDEQSGNSFTIIANEKPEFKLQGIVQWSEGVARPSATITYNCASDDVAEDEIDDCTIWQGVVYALKDGADAEFLPRNDEPAAAAILLPDFVSMLDSYDFGTAKPAEPLNWDVFRFKACTPEE
ncbi:hypothetical protein P8H26_06385 [Pseudochrobactrum sp. sp1633]|uniref:hypothetical protein n=1 Tax=Pseudochrobactrum sp. sp1633 TaxID=3036706 RepID=UPI0025A5391C|nr:hypothetical protein [Pseudochrobactrum sp. sp1633]MDM8345017.1 hypothetical protein [Pseudochrobactrum sp. sp1633]HWD14849.1 hypothetical protein [Pseudochrobactrum sp.]